LTEAAKRNRYSHRGSTTIVAADRHGFRPTELIALRWDQIDFEHGHLHVRRAKNGSPSTHPIPGDVLRALAR
jgi:type 1 fimbriae regulatory protein FimB/type 1 fimbriae regulatory protein FimE